MRLINPKINSCYKYHGGKSYLTKDIIPLIDDGEIFVDACCGGCNIIFNADHPRGIAIDRDIFLIQTLNTIKNWPYDLYSALKSVEYTEDAFIEAIAYFAGNYRYDGIDLAKNYIIRNRMSRGGMGKTFAWSERLRGGLPGDVNAWNNFLDKHYWRIAERCKTIEFTHGCMREALGWYDILSNKKAVVYIDPPYVKSSRTMKNVYQHEMFSYDKEVPNPCNQLTHEGLWKMMDSAKCKFYISGYYNDAYVEFIQKCKRKVSVVMEKDIANHSGQNKVKQRRKEVLWALV